MKNGCSDPSESFTTYTFTLLSDVLQDLDQADFSPCEYLPQLQQKLFLTASLSENVTFESLVVVSDSLQTELQSYFGNNTDLSGSFVSRSFSIS